MLRLFKDEVSKKDQRADVNAIGKWRRKKMEKCITVQFIGVQATLCWSLILTSPGWPDRDPNQPAEIRHTESQWVYWSQDHHQKSKTGVGLVKCYQPSLSRQTFNFFNCSYVSSMTGKNSNNWLKEGLAPEKTVLFFFSSFHNIWYF